MYSRKTLTVAAAHDVSAEPCSILYAQIKFVKECDKHVDGVGANQEA